MTPEDQLNLRLQHPDYQTFLDINESESDRVKEEYTCHLDIQYGSFPLQNLDIFPSKVDNSPILIFIHGGYWRALDKSSYRFIAETFVKNNMTVCIINYRLIPAVNMKELVHDVKEAIVWIQNKADQYHGNPGNIALAGHSAGGHLALLAYLMNKNMRPDIQGICSVSGIFDLVPIKNSYLNDTLQLHNNDVYNFSVSNKDLSVIQCPVLLTVGSDETDFFIEQSKELFLRYSSSGCMHYYEYEQQNHYQIIHRMGEENSMIAKFIQKLRIS